MNEAKVGPEHGEHPGLVTKRGVASFLGVSTRTVEAYQRQGLPYYRLGPRRNRYDLSAVRAWLDRQCRTVRIG